MAEFNDLIKYALGGWQVTAAAPVIFAAIIIITLAIWGAMRWRYGGVIAKKDATIQTLGTTITLVKTQSEALAREIDSLNGTITTLKSQTSTDAPPAQRALSIVHVESIVVNITRLNEQLAHTLTGIDGATRISATTAMYASLTKTPLTLQAEADKEPPK